MGKRLKFKCWNCGKTYSLYREITKEQTLVVACPFCSADAVADLDLYRKKVKDLFKGLSSMPATVEEKEPDLGEEFDFPEVLPTQKKPE